MKHGLTLPPLSLYVHIPWCVRKCPYCDFNSHALPGNLPDHDYLRALLEDLDQDLDWAEGRGVQSIFFGGGTPSLLSPGFFARLLEALNRRLHLAPDVEITLEANPGTVEQERFNGYRAAGINRLSIGIQSFQRDQLAALGRIHDGDDARRAIDSARQAGFDNFNLDLMHGLPGQTPDQALSDLATALTFQPPHLSWYQLTIEPNTEFYRRPPTLPDEERLWEIQEAGAGRLAAAGYENYEISAWCLTGREARHNLNYWTFGDYLAVGAGAHGKLTLPESNRIFRYWKTRQPEHYLGRIGSRTAGTADIEIDDRPLEFLMNALRLRRGTSEALFAARTGLSLSSIRAPLEAARTAGLIEPGRLAPTEQGRLHLNGLLEMFLR